MFQRATACIVMGLLGAGCVGGPRAFTPTLAVADPALAAQAPPDAVVRQCDALVRAGQRANFSDAQGRNAAAGTGAAAGVGGTGLAVGSAIGGFGGLGLATVSLVAMPVVGVLAAYGVSRSRRARAEREIQTATGDCLAEHGYSVTVWRPTEPESRSPGPKS